MVRVFKIVSFLYDRAFFFACGETFRQIFLVISMRKRMRIKFIKESDSAVLDEFENVWNQNRSTYTNYGGN